MTPENTLVIRAVASATPSIAPTVVALAPSTVTMKTGNKLCTISDEISISMLTKPSNHTVAGIRIRGSTGSILDMDIARDEEMKMTYSNKFRLQIALLHRSQAKLESIPWLNHVIEALYAVPGNIQISRAGS